MGKDSKGHGSNGKGTDTRLFSGPNTRPMRGTPAQVPKGHVNIANGRGGYVTRGDAQKAIKMHEKDAAKHEALAGTAQTSREARQYERQASYSREAAEMHRKALGGK